MSLDTLLLAGKRGVRSALPPLLFLGLTWYACWNAVYGDHGLQATRARREDLAVARGNLAQAQTEQAAWERRVAGLQSGHLDGDSLDEQARGLLNMADPGDIVAPYAKGRHLF